jgi:hypothetical protein
MGQTPGKRYTEAVRRLRIEQAKFVGMAGDRLTQDVEMVAGAPPAWPAQVEIAEFVSAAEQPRLVRGFRKTTETAVAGPMRD